jgi:hypothetical protein
MYGEWGLLQPVHVETGRIYLVVGSFKQRCLPRFDPISKSICTLMDGSWIELVLCLLRVSTMRLNIKPMFVDWKLLCSMLSYA